MKQNRYQFLARVKALVDNGKLMKATHEQIHSDFLSELWQEVNSRTDGGSRRYTASMAGYVQGAFDVLASNLWQDVEFVYRDDSGKIYGTHRDSIYPSWHGRFTGAEVGNMERAHVWKGTDKVFTDWSK
jgi:hypothetical protein